MAKTFVMGDIHGAYKALIQCLERSNFDYDNDTLIQLGDVCDGWKDVANCVEELTKIRNLIAIRGNHDEPFAQFFQLGLHPWRWKQGGVATAQSYLRPLGKEDDIYKMNGAWEGDNDYGYGTSLNPSDIPEIHKYFFEHQISYYIDDKNRLFIHGGFNRHFPLKEQMEYIYMWDRDLWNAAMSFQSMAKNDITKNVKFKVKGNYPEIFIGHTTTMCWKTDKPMKAANVWNLDTGAGFSGKLTIMDVETKEYWQSDNVKELYPDWVGR